MRITVLRVIARLNVGGPAIHATLLTSRLDPDRYDSILVHGPAEEHEGDYLTLTETEVPGRVVVPSLGRELGPFRDWRAFRDLVRVIRKHRPHIVHTHTAKAGTLGRLAAWWCGVPIVVHTFHGHVLHGYFSPAKTAVFIRLERLLARMSHRLVAVNDTVRTEVLDRGIGHRDRFEVVRLGFDLQKFARSESRRGELRASLSVDPSTRLVGIVARLVPIKAHEVFLAMAARVAREQPDTLFLVVGDGERRTSLEQVAADLGLGDRIRFLGWRGDLDRVYADLDVVVLTSRNEGSPVALIEAMAAARPVVATRAGGVEELVADAGVLTDIDDVDALADGVVGLLRDPARAARLGLAGRARVLPIYGHDRLIGDMDALYTRLLADRGTRA